MGYSWRTKFTETEAELIAAKSGTLAEGKRFTDEELAQIADQTNPPQGKLLYKANEILKESIRDKDQLEADRQRYLKKPCTRGEALYFAVDASSKVEERLEKYEIALSALVRFVDLLFEALSERNLVSMEEMKRRSEERAKRDLAEGPEEQPARETSTDEVPVEPPPASESDQQ